MTPRQGQVGRPAAQVDGHFEGEARAVRELGGQVALVDHDALTLGRVAEAVARVPQGFGPVWCRGWMLDVEAYHALEKALGRRGCRLLTGWCAYRSGHELPGWIDCFRELTPATVVVPMTPGEAPPGPRELGSPPCGPEPSVH
ncbi:hypothetical protein [Nonomuraea cavernae]|uniref:Uncharacterized protein n=1 Tax=Nonomuraea cavernae TaxID=2045107 RepID=A0A918DE82_9ACTN|nr:hypothetical protein [Nonomuraea cavernae]MCA2183529.1 hypothetical protein [Nonomuraea cavernae]GGO60571.1 hypothetical protein GCM10012289_00750 [Nonomuraea cavernae]